MVDFTPFIEASLAIKIHIVAALIAVALTPFALWRERRDKLHKIFGYSWISAMTVTALSSFAITSFGVIGPFSPLHLLSILALWSMFTAVRHAIRGEIRQHQQALRNLATFGLGLPLVLNFLPERTFTRAFSADNYLNGLLVMSVVLGAVMLWRLSVRRRKVRFNVS